MAAGKLLATAGLGAALVAGGFLAVAEKGRSALRSDVEAFFQSAAAGKFDEAYAATSKSFQGKNPRENFESLLKNGGFTGFKEIEWKQVGFDESGGVASGTVITKEGSRFEFDLNLEKSDGKWRLREIVADGRDSASVSSGNGNAP